MTRLRVFLSRVAGLLWGSRQDAELVEDIDTHLAFLADEYRRGGLSDDEARVAARKAFGGVEQTREAVRDVRSFVWVEEARQDLGYAARMLRRTPLFSAAAVMALSLGIGSATVMSSVVRGLLLYPLPYRGADRLVMVEFKDTESDRGRHLHWDEVEALRAQSTAFDGVVATDVEPVTLATPTGVELARGVWVSPDFFTVMGIDPQIGRAFGPQDMTPASPRVAILRYRTWVTHFASDPRAIGRTIRVNGDPLTIVGVMPRRFTFQGADVWVSAPLATNGPYGVFCYARLKPGVSAEAAAAQLNVIAAREPNSHRNQDERKFRVTVQPLLAELVGHFRTTVYTAFAAAALLLLIACCNVANMLLARMTAREREMIVRAALGAGRGRIVRQVLVEGLLLALLGVLGGCLLAYGGTNALVQLLPEGAVPSEVQLRIDGAALATSVVLGLLSAVIFGAAPGLYSARRNLVDGLRGDSRTTAGTGGPLRHGLLVVQVALSLVLLVGAGLLMRNFASLVRTDVGVDASRLLVMSVLPTSGQPDTPTDQQRFYDEVLPRIAGLPEAEGAASTDVLPPGPGFVEAPSAVDGHPEAVGSTSLVQFCTGGYFHTVGLRLTRGRVFSLADHRGASQVAVVNQALVRRYFARADPIGQHIEVDLSALVGRAERRRMVEVIGVVADAKNAGLRAPAAPQLYLPGVGQTVVVRSTGDPTRLLRSVDAEIRAAGRHVDLRSVATLDKVLELSDYARPRFSMTVLSVFAVVGTAIVMMGIFGVFAYTVSRETRAIAIRMALGASEWAVVSEVLGGGFRVILLGVALGVPLSLAVGRLLASQLWGVGPHDPVTLLGSIGFVGVVALAASYLPARRAASVDPLVTLRQGSARLPRDSCPLVLAPGQDRSHPSTQHSDVMRPGFQRCALLADSSLGILHQASSPVAATTAHRMETNVRRGGSHCMTEGYWYTVSRRSAPSPLTEAVMSTPAVIARLGHTAIRCAVATLVSFVVCASPQTVAASPITWTVSGSDYSGTFDYDVDTNQFSNISVVSTFFDPFPPTVTYTALDFSPASATDFMFTFENLPLLYYLDFHVPGGLTGAGGDIAGTVVEYIVDTDCDDDVDFCSVPVQPLDIRLSSSSDTTGAPVPEPASLTLLGLGLAGMAARRWRQRKVS